PRRSDCGPCPTGCQRPRAGNLAVYPPTARSRTPADTAICQKLNLNPKHLSKKTTPAMKSILLSCMALLMSGILWSQSAPDFTVTDTDGQEHHLYADYL